MASGNGAPPGSRYVDQRHFVVAASLSDLRGPVRGDMPRGLRTRPRVR
jgi:hypothetical protein